jgi:hypothetical protein
VVKTSLCQQTTAAVFLRHKEHISRFGMHLPILITA